MIDSGIHLRDYPSPEPVDLSFNPWFWSILLFPVIFLALWMLYRRRPQSATLIDPLIQVLERATDNNLSMRDRFENLYSVIRSHLANKYDQSWYYLTAEEIKIFNSPAGHDFEHDLHLRNQWLKIETLAYSNEEITQSNLDAILEIAKILLFSRKMKN